MVLFMDMTYSNIENRSQTLIKLHHNIPEESQFIDLVQKSMKTNLDEITYLSIINWTGRYICYPDITQLGETIPSGKNTKFKGDINGSRLYEHYFGYFNNLKKQSDYEIINLTPIKDSDLIIVYHLNLNKVLDSISQIKERIYITFVILGLFLLITLATIVRIVRTHSNKLLEEKVLNLEYSAQNLVKLNESITQYQQKIERKELGRSQEKAESPKEAGNEKEVLPNEETSKQRILTYIRNELISILITDIAYIYVDNTITYIICKDGSMSTTGDSLDKMYSVLDKELFFKTNRQFIIAISAIEKITKFENNKLKIQVKPKSEIDIIIGKNKASAFKQWLDL